MITARQRMETEAHYRTRSGQRRGANADHRVAGPVGLRAEQRLRPEPKWVRGLEDAEPSEHKLTES